VADDMHNVAYMSVLSPVGVFGECVSLAQPPSVPDASWAPPVTPAQTGFTARLIDTSSCVFTLERVSERFHTLEMV